MNTRKLGVTIGTVAALALVAVVAITMGQEGSTRGPSRSIGTPLIAMTAVPRTPRPTLTPMPSVTPTGTPMPTPTNMFKVVGNGTPCAPDAPEVPYDVSLHGVGGDWLHGEAKICLPDDASVHISGFVSWHGPNGGGQGITIGRIAGPMGPVLQPPAYDNPYNPNDFGGCHYVLQELDGDFSPLPGDSQITLSWWAAGGGIFGCYEQYEDLERHIGPATGGPTLTPVVGCWISEILPHDQGVTSPDWNLRSGGGANDDFVEVACNPAQSIAGWQVCADADCYTVKTDNWTGPLKTFWRDEWPVWSGDFPITGTLTLKNAVGTTVDSLTYSDPGDGNCWAASAWTNPTGVWWSYPCSPGWGGVH